MCILHHVAMLQHAPATKLFARVALALLGRLRAHAVDGAVVTRGAPLRLASWAVARRCADPNQPEMDQSADLLGALMPARGNRRKVCIDGSAMRCIIASSGH
eukprot:COSAG06_NODE_9591_length_1863_cov_93.458617_4_plen_102_part_00